MGNALAYVPFGILAFLVIFLLIFLFWPKQEVQLGDFGKEPTALDPLDNSPLEKDAVEIFVRASSGRLVRIKMNRHNAEIVKHRGLEAFPAFGRNLNNYASRHKANYRSRFAPETYYMIGDGDDFDPIWWWIWYDILFNHPVDAPAFGWDSSGGSPAYCENLDKLSETPGLGEMEKDPAGLQEYLDRGEKDPVFSQSETVVGHQPDLVYESPPDRDTIIGGDLPSAADHVESSSPSESFSPDSGGFPDSGGGSFDSGGGGAD